MTNLQFIASAGSLLGIDWLANGDISPVELDTSGAVILALAAVTFILAFLGGKR